MQNLNVIAIVLFILSIQYYHIVNFVLLFIPHYRAIILFMPHYHHIIISIVLLLLLILFTLSDNSMYWNRSSKKRTVRVAIHNTSTKLKDRYTHLSSYFRLGWSTKRVFQIFRVCIFKTCGPNGPRTAKPLRSANQEGGRWKSTQRPSLGAFVCDGRGLKKPLYRILGTSPLCGGIIYWNRHFFFGKTIQVYEVCMYICGGVTKKKFLLVRASKPQFQ